MSREAPDIVLVEDNYTSWEAFVPKMRLPTEKAAEMLDMMLTRWYSNADMYASELRRKGMNAVRCVPSIRSRRPMMVTHKLGHKVLLVPVEGDSSSGPIQALQFNMRLSRIFRGSPSVVHFSTYYSSYYASSMFWHRKSAVLAQYSGGEPRAVAPIAERLRWLVPIGLRLRNSSGVLIGDFSREERRQRKILTGYYRIKETKMHDFPALAVDPTLFYDRGRNSACAILGFNKELIHILVVSAIPRKARINELTKNPFAVLDAFSSGNTKAFPWHLHFAGSGPGYEELAEAARVYGVEKRITLHGHIEHELLPFYYSACSLVINPYNSFDLRVGTATMEGLSCSRPVIMFKRLPSLDFEQPGGFLLDANQQMRESELVKILKDPDGLIQKGREGPAIAQRFALPPVVDRLAEIYRFVAGSRK